MLAEAKVFVRARRGFAPTGVPYVAWFLRTTPHDEYLVPRPKSIPHVALVAEYIDGPANEDVHMLDALPYREREREWREGERVLAA